jgi:hypothetical protein
MALEMDKDDRVRNEVLHRLKMKRTTHKIQSRKANWISYILRRNCLTKRTTEGEIRKKNRNGRKTATG